MFTFFSKSLPRFGKTRARAGPPAMVRFARSFGHLPDPPDSRPRQTPGAPGGLPALTALLALLALLPHAAASAERAVLSVQTVAVAASEAQVRLEAQGNLAAWREASVSSETQGLTIVALLADVGERVVQGAVLARFDARVPAAELEQARAQLLEAQVALDEAQLQVERTAKLRQQGFISEAQLTQVRSTQAAAQARLASARALVQLREVRLAQTELRAPEAGVVVARTASLGAVPQPGIELFRLIAQGRLEWRAELTAQDLARVRPGAAARIQLPDASSVTGRVRMLAPSVDLQTRNALVHVDLNADLGRLRPGMFVRGEIELGSRQSLLVPQTAIVVRDGFSLVFRLDKDQRVQAIRVKTGRVLGERVEVTEGLSGGETIVARGAAFLHQGDLVRVAPHASPGLQR